MCTYRRRQQSRLVVPLGTYTMWLPLLSPLVLCKSTTGLRERLPMYVHLPIWIFRHTLIFNICNSLNFSQDDENILCSFKSVSFSEVVWRCSLKKGVLRNFAKFTGKHLCQSLFFNKIAGIACNFIKKRDSGTDVFWWILRIFLEHLFLHNTSSGCFCIFDGLLWFEI